MKTTILLLFLGIAAILPTLQAQPSQTKDGKSVKKVIQVMYFHGERRCTTCKTIEKVAMETIKEQYANNPRVVFKEINHEDKKNAALVEKYQIAGSSLVIQGAGKEYKDLTVEAFQFATRDPGKLQALVIATVDKYLK